MNHNLIVAYNCTGKVFPTVKVVLKYHMDILEEASETYTMEPVKTTSNHIYTTDRLRL